MKVSVDYDSGWAIVRDAIWPGSGKEYVAESATRAVQKRFKEDNKFGLRLENQTNALEAWEQRRTRTPFKRPTGEFVFRITDPSNKNNIGRSEMNEWPKTN